MTDERYTFVQTVQERKSTGRGAFHKKSGSKSRKCSLPTDYMTESQWKRRNSTVSIYNPNAPMSYAEFKKLSPSAQSDYLHSLVDVHKARHADLQDLFGVSHQTINNILNRIPNRPTFVVNYTGKMAPEWEAFLNKATAPDTEPESIPEPTPEPTPEPISVPDTQDDMTKDSNTDRVTPTNGVLYYKGTPAVILEEFFNLLNASKTYNFALSFFESDDK